MRCSSISTQRANWLMHSSGAALRRKCCKKLWQRLPTIRRGLGSPGIVLVIGANCTGAEVAERGRLLGHPPLALRAARTGVISASLLWRSADPDRTELTRAILALALRAPSPRRSGVQNRSRRFCDIANGGEGEIARGRGRPLVLRFAPDRRG